MHYNCHRANDKSFWNGRCTYMSIKKRFLRYNSPHEPILGRTKWQKLLHIICFLTRFVTKQTIVPALVRPNCTSHRKTFASTVGVSKAHYREAGVDLFLEGHRFTPTPNPGHDSSRSCQARIFTRPTYRIHYKTIFMSFVVV